MQVSQVFGCRLCRPLYSPRISKRVLQIVISIGVFAWTLFLTTYTTRMISPTESFAANDSHIGIRNIDPQNRTVSNPQKFIVHEVVEDAEVDDCAWISNSVNNIRHGLELQSILITESRRTAVICNQCVEQGETVTIHGVSANVTLVTSRFVQLLIDGATVRLPLFFGGDSAHAPISSAELCNDVSHVAGETSNKNAETDFQ